MENIKHWLLLIVEVGYTGGILKKLCDTSEHQFFVYVRVSGDI